MKKKISQCCVIKQYTQTEKLVTANRSDVIKNKKEKLRTLTDVAILADRSVVQKKLKYKSLGTDMKRVWNLKCTIIPVITGATGIVTKRLRKNLEAIPGNIR
jgi:hypothetical protein